MHAQALAFIAAHLPLEVGSVLEFGSRNINGSPRDLVPAATRYVGVDISDGAGVDVMHDAATVRIPGKFDVVICAEVFEHAPDTECLEMLHNAAAHLRKGGTLIATMAGEGRAPHSARDGAELQPDEFYRNVSRDLLNRWLKAAGFAHSTINVAGPDIRCVAVK
jgi:hypothetical protein